MNDFLSLVSPETRAIIWIPKQENETQHPHYKTIDYLCDGILTASLPALNEKSSLVIAARNFGSTLMIFVARTLVKKELESFLSLVKIEEFNAGDILLVDDGNLIAELEGMLTKTVTAKLKRVN